MKVRIKQIGMVYQPQWRYCFIWFDIKSDSPCNSTATTDYRDALETVRLIVKQNTDIKPVYIYPSQEELLK